MPLPRRIGVNSTSLGRVREEDVELRRPWIGIVWLAVAAGAMGLGLGRQALIDPDEGRNAAVGLAMAVSGDYVVPRLNGLPHLDKPALFHAAEAVAIRAFGASELAARLPALVSAWATVALTFWFARGLFGRGAGWIAGTACATAPLAIAMARTAIFDSTLSLFVVLALMSFYLAVESEPRENEVIPKQAISMGRRWALLAWAAMALGVLTKGPVALVVPLLVAIPYALWRRRSAVVWHLSGPLVHLSIVLPWALAVESRVPGFLRYALVTETWQRLTTDDLHRGGPIWYFLPYLLAGCFPWIVVAAAAGWERFRGLSARERPALVYLALWVIVPLLFFSLSHSKRPQYILPLMPALALWTAWAWSLPAGRERAVRAGAIAWLVCGSLLNVAAAFLTPRKFGGDAELAADARSTALALGAVMMVAGALAWLALRRSDLAFVALSLPLVVLPLVTAPLAVALAGSRSAKALATALRPHVGPDTRIVGIETFSPSLTFYLGRPVHLSAANGQPLGSNYLLRSYATLANRDSTLHGPGWWSKRLKSCSQPLIFLLENRYREERRTLAAAGLPVLYEDRRLVAMGPCTAGGPVAP
jgi:4-amino-4-deoxy-L-arabinose transferase-like glycosyltransferase